MSKSKNKAVMEWYPDNTVVFSEKRELIDKKTGEEIICDQFSKTVYGSQNFWKVYLMDFLGILGIFDTRQVDVFIYVVENTNPSNNLFIGSQQKIANDIGCGTATVSRIFKRLQENNFVKKIQNGVWFVNPRILMKGNEHKRQILLSYYQADEPIDEITFSRTKREEIEEKPIIGQLEIIDKDMNTAEVVTSEPKADNSSKLKQMAEDMAKKEGLDPARVMGNGIKDI